MGTSMMVVRFPGGRIKFGAYQNTSDIGSPWLADTAVNLRALIGRGCAGLPKDGPIVEVDIYCTYGGGFSGRTKARGGHLVEHARFWPLWCGWEDLPANVTDYHEDGVPMWAADAMRELSGKPKESTP